MKQPWGIVVNCIFLILGILACLLGLVALQFASVFTGSLPVVGMLAGYAFLLFILMIVYGGLCYGLWIHNKIAWWILIVLNGLGVISALSGFIVSAGMGLISLVIVVVLFAGLLHRDTIAVVDPGIDYKGWTLE